MLGVRPAAPMPHLGTPGVRVTSPRGFVGEGEVSVLGFCFPGPRSWLWSPAYLLLSTGGSAACVPRDQLLQHDSPPSFTVGLLCRRPFADPFVQELRDVFCSAAALELTCLFSLHPGKIISIDTSSLRAAGRTGWEDLVRKCIYAFFQPQGREPSYAKQLFQEGNRLLSPALSLSC